MVQIYQLLIWNVEMEEMKDMMKQVMLEKKETKNASRSQAENLKEIRVIRKM